MSNVHITNRSTGTASSNSDNLVKESFIADYLDVAKQMFKGEATMHDLTHVMSKYPHIPEKWKGEAQGQARVLRDQSLNAKKQS